MKSGLSWEGFYLVTDLQGNPIWKRSYNSLSKGARCIGKVAALLEPGTLWAWGRVEEEAWEVIKERVEKLDGTEPLKLFEG